MCRPQGRTLLSRWDAKCTRLYNDFTPGKIKDWKWMEIILAASSTSHTPTYFLLSCADKLKTKYVLLTANATTVVSSPKSMATFPFKETSKHLCMTLWWHHFNNISKNLVRTLHKYNPASLKDGDYSEKYAMLLLNNLEHTLDFYLLWC